MQLTPPSASNGYTVTVEHELSAELLNAIFGSVDLRLVDLEAMKIDAQLAIDAVLALSAETVVATLAEEIEAGRSGLAEIRSEFTALQDEYEALQTGGIFASRIQITPIPGLDAVNVQQALAGKANTTAVNAALDGKATAAQGDKADAAMPKAGGAFSGLVTFLSTQYATQPEAETGTASVGLMTPERTAQAVAAQAQAKALGHGQTWQVVARALDTSYQNITARPIMVAMSFQALSTSRTSGLLEVSADNSIWIQASTGASPGGGAYGGVSGIVPPGHYYRFKDGTTSGSGTGPLSTPTFQELR